MTNVNYITNPQGQRTSVIIDLIKYGNLWEDFYDKIMIEERKNDKRIPIENVKKQLIKKGKL